MFDTEWGYQDLQINSDILLVNMYCYCNLDHRPLSKVILIKGVCKLMLHFVKSYLFSQ